MTPTPVWPVVAYCRSAGHPEPVPEYRFHPVRMWRFDLAWPGAKLALELEGVTRSAGRHQRVAGYEADCLKYGEALVMRWWVLRATPKQLQGGLVFHWLDRFFATEKASLR